MKLFDIVKSLQEAQGNINKQAILMQHKDNELFKEYMRAIYDTGINYYQKKIVPAKTLAVSPSKEFSQETIDQMIGYLAERKDTGNKAIATLSMIHHSLNGEGQELIKSMIDRSIGASVGDTMVLKTWPDLYFTVGYQRCSLLDAKAKEKFSKLDIFACQEKADGSFLYLMKEEDKSAQAITRAGSRYPREFAEQLAEGVPNGLVLIGELLVFTNPPCDGKMDVLNRQTANGMLNSILKGGDVDRNFLYKMFAWDIITVEEFKAGRSSLVYKERMKELESITAKSTIPNVEKIETTWVTSLEEAYKIYSAYTAQGLEGAVIKTEDFLWKDGTSKDCVKLKIEFEIDLEITGVVEGSGKAAGMMGALQLRSSCGGLVTDVGTGFDDITRKQFWQGKDELVGMIVAVKANDIISKRDRSSKSLFLPVFLECRVDKKVADNLEDCERILMAAKGLK